MKPYARAERVGVKIQVAITELLSKKVQDPRMEMTTVSHVKVSPDLRVADVYITVYGDKRRSREAIEGFKKSKGFIKKSIAPKLGLKYMPDLRFVYDDSFDKAAHMDALIKNAVSDNSEEAPPCRFRLINEKRISCGKQTCRNIFCCRGGEGETKT